ncbi:hypothetical protein LOZ12_004493 [Ophidiomyces ophidiicola]|uniref:Uncharacterized protein n=1 Tax=Ophidiomyces ophidiicola TaxID=1387563 RepID=A0ACB8UYV7_9EURO|nr:uncharacterized protein LOZ57_000148 [Ophidiomyces ophidiicola]KAI1908614.1 hypothetical protein LOZ61_005469 [Ophidiomyces ophidiicola]KAI1910559.1 hypothetical protein LOZ64_004939 [Ophidiomyces ophidiicola]KAI1923731.1 hypothetical protein LOZ60_005079 [Ophidiomyces ophidiicola]KAI1953807.1 hypothetical protein LOZ57_000148 [Ophidiomyces ophidiicola]KAI1954783.1 hypothetical protein LOZ62_000560 [Ophidiomyces ophidiicola]
MKIFSKVFLRLFKPRIRQLSSWNSDDLFTYTSGRFLFNEEVRRSERFVRFDVNALAAVICRCANRSRSELTSITKLAEGGFNRILQATFSDGYAVLARIPYRTTIPKHYAIASEAATLGLLYARGIPVPKVLGYSSDSKNSVGTEYLLLEKLNGTPLGDQWFTMDNKTRVKIMRQIVNVEKQWMSIELPASGSLFYLKDLQPPDFAIPLSEQPTSDQIVVGPTAQLQWWYEHRSSLTVNRGPWKTFRECFEAPAKREIEFCERFGKPRLHIERYLRELHHFKEMSPTVHASLLAEVLMLISQLDLPPSHPFSRPVLRHPDFSPNNILINDSHDIVGVIDWQHAVALPLCLCAGIPDHFQNWGDPLSESLAKPELTLPENFDTLSEEEQERIQESMRKRLVHFYYAAMTLKQLPDHFDALRTNGAMLRAKLFNRAGAPWEGDSLSLRHTIIQVCTCWPLPYDDTPRELGPCPVQYSEEQRNDFISQYNQEQEKLEELSDIRAHIGIDSQGWVPDDDHLAQAKAIAQSIKAGLLAHSETDIERIALQQHFPFDDHDERA